VRVRRILRVLVRNWPLRLGAIALALVLYVGLVILQNARVWPGPIQIDAINQPPGTFLVANLGDVTSVRYVAPLDVAAQVTSSSFLATANLAGVQASGGSTTVNVPVSVIARDSRIQVISWDPATVVARLDPVISRVVPVRVDRGTVPEGLTATDPTVVPTTVTVTGASSLVSQVAAALARVTIDASGVNVDANVDLIAIDDRGQQVTPVDLQPGTVHVTIQVGEQLVNRTVPVVPSISGMPGTGYAIRDVTVTPATVTVSGSGTTIGSLTSVPTTNIDLTGRTTDLLTSVAVQPPAGVTILGSSKVQVRVRFQAATGSRSFGAGVTLTGARADRSYTLSVPDVLVTLGGSEAALDAVDPSSLAASVDVSRLDVGTFSLTVTFAPPSGTTLVAVSPATVTITVAPPPTPAPSPSPGL
jgi:YbbR domain-containing protein